MGIHSAGQVALLTDYEKESAYSNAYYNLYENIRFGWDRVEHAQYAIALTAPIASAGSNVAAANVAIASAQSGTLTILVDVDTHTPELAQRFRLEPRHSLSDLLASEALTSQVLDAYLSETFIPCLRVLSLGHSPLSALEFRRLLSSRLQDFLTSACQWLARHESRPGLIVFNSPPVLAGITAAQISSLVDQTFLLISSGHTTRTQIKKAQEQLQRAHARLAGIIMMNA